MKFDTAIISSESSTLDELEEERKLTKGERIFFIRKEELIWRERKKERSVLKTTHRDDFDGDIQRFFSQERINEALHSISFSFQRLPLADLINWNC